MDRIILHCDCNSFFASVETALNPEYKNVPMAVCGSESDRHGIVLAKNELAKKYNIKTAETVFSARKKCPNLVIAKPHYGEYTKYSKAVNEIYARYTDMIEPFGIDESWLDVTASQKLFGTGEMIAEQIRQAVKREIGITVSIGVSFNKVFAKLGSDYKKPDAITVIDRSNYREIAYPLPVGDLLFVGGKTAATLYSMGIKTIGALAETDETLLKMRFGKMGTLLYRYSNGLDDSPVNSEREDAKSVGNGFTFRHDLVGFDECRAGIDFLVEEVGARLRKNGQLCSTVQLTIKDEFLRSYQRQKPQNPPTDISREIAKTAYEILSESWSENRPVRMLTVTATNLISKDMSAEQIDIFSDADTPKNQKGEKREEALDKIRKKFGFSSIISASVADPKLGIYENKSEEKKKSEINADKSSRKNN